MDYVSNEHPIGGFFGGGYESAFQAIRLDSDKNQATGSDLGIITKLQVSCTGGDFQKNSYDSALATAELFALQDLACKALPEKQTRATKDGGSYDTYVHRVNYCIKQRVDASRSVFVRYNENRKKPIMTIYNAVGAFDVSFCARQITEGRREELKTAMANWQKTVVMCIWSL